MAAPTSVSVESTSITTATLRWVYGGSAVVKVYRSTDGVSYSDISDLGVVSGTLTYTDETLSPGVKYWYKLTDDSGATFSSVVTVVAQVCAGPVSPPSPVDISEGGFQGVDDITAERLNKMVRRIEDGFNTVVLDADECLVCPVDGAIIFDCLRGCKRFVLIADEDINSISIINCEDSSGPIDIIIPTGTRRICGWPAGFGFSGNECNEAPLIGPRTVTVTGGGGGGPSRSRPGTGRGIGRGGGSGAGGSGCTCVPTNGALTIKSCNNNNSLNCSSTKKLRLIACGGVGPYTWSKSGSGIQLSATEGPSTTVTPVTNSGAAVVGTAYWIDCYVCNTCSSGTCTAHGVGVGGEYDCNDVWTSALPGDPSPCDRISICATGITAGQLSGCCNGNTSLCATVPCVDVRSGCPSGVTQMCDRRTAGMITDGCNPCGLNQGATVTVTDAAGTQTTIILRA